MNKLLIPILLLIALNGNGQIFEIEYGGGAHYANFKRQSLTPKYTFQTNERYYTNPSMTLLLRMNFGWDSFPVHFFLLNHLNIEYSLDYDRMFENTILQNSAPGFAGKLSQYSLFFGPGFALPPIGNFLMHVNLGVGLSAIRMPSVYFDCKDCPGAKLTGYSQHGGMGIGGLLEASVAYRFSEKIRVGMTYSFHGGRIYNTSVEFWKTDAGNRQEIPTPNMIHWKNALISWGFVYSLRRSSSSTNR